MNENISEENLILKSCLTNSQYLSKIITFLKAEYFERSEDQQIYTALKKFYDKYEKCANCNVLSLFFNKNWQQLDLTEPQLKNLQLRLREVEDYSIDEIDDKYLLDETEKFGKKRAIYISLNKSIGYLNKDSDTAISKIISIFENAAAVSLDNSIGHNYVDDIEQRIEFYNNNEERFPTHLSRLNGAVGGGLMKKTLNIFFGEPGMGKSRMLVDLCANYVKSGLNVLYITLELPELNVAQRFDSNLLDVDINSLAGIDKTKFTTKFSQLSTASWGKLRIKEYPMDAVTVSSFKALVSELKYKQKFIADVIAIDYMGVQLPQKGGDNLYERGKNIATENRGFFTENNVIGLTAGQLNRQGWGVSSVTLANIADSAGYGQAADLCVALFGVEDLLTQNKMTVKILKTRLSNRFGGNSTFLTGFDNNKMRHFDVEQGDLITTTNESENTTQFRPKKEFSNFDFG